MKIAIRVIFRIISVLLILPVMFVLTLLFGWIGGRIYDHMVRNEVFAYVRQNRETIELIDPERYQEFFYSASGLQDGGTEYGYYFEPNDAYVMAGEPYRGGYRMFGIPDDDADWYYTERICENWFYYEIHDG